MSSEDDVSVGEWFKRMLKKTLLFFGMMVMSFALITLCAMYYTEIIDLSLYTSRVLLNSAP